MIDWFCGLRLQPTKRISTVMLPDAISLELFDIDFIASDVAIDHLNDQLEELGFDVSAVESTYLKITILLSTSHIKAELIVDRINDCFIACATVYDIVVAQVYGGWDLIIDYLRFLFTIKPSLVGNRYTGS